MLCRQQVCSRFFIHQLLDGEGDLIYLSSHSYMRYKESMCRIIALLEIKINIVNIETIATIY